LGLAWGDSSIGVGRNDSLFDRSRGFFEAVIPERSGLVDLRLDFARILIQYYRPEDAALQIGEAVNLRPDDPEVWTYQAWLELEKDNPDEADRLLKQALASEPAPDLARVLTARMAGGQAMDELYTSMLWAVPYYVFDPISSQYQTMGQFPQWQRDMLRQPLEAVRPQK